MRGREAAEQPLVIVALSYFLWVNSKALTSLRVQGPKNEDVKISIRHMMSRRQASFRVIKPMVVSTNLEAESWLAYHRRVCANIASSRENKRNFDSFLRFFQVRPCSDPNRTLCELDRCPVRGSTIL
jgi:predicted DNA-binding ribbon-helix-helix protein